MKDHSLLKCSQLFNKICKTTGDCLGESKLSWEDCPIMKFKRENKVEFLRRTKDQQCDSWFPGKIISVDGDQCIVRYDLFFNLEREQVEEKVHQEYVRPRPPLGKDEKRWVLGDIAEVFHLHCWRVGKIVKVLKNSNFVIRLFGSIQLKEFHQSYLRVRQAWKNNNWVMIGEVGGVEESQHRTKHNISSYSQRLDNGGPQPVSLKATRDSEEDGQERHKTGAHERTMKQNRDNHSSTLLDDAVVEFGYRKRKATMNVEGYDRLPMRTLPLSKQVNIVSSQKVDIVKRSIFESSKMNVQTENTNGHSSCPLSVPVLISEESNACSVASCGSNDFQEYDAQNSRKSSREVGGHHYDDAESFCPSISWEKQSTSYVDEEIEANVHSLELHAYKRTLQAFYASGPLSWEQESLLTNLRLSLRISNEEHLLHLKQLLSTQVL